MGPDPNNGVDCRNRISSGRLRNVASGGFSRQGASYATGVSDTSQVELEIIMVEGCNSGINTFS